MSSDELAAKTVAWAADKDLLKYSNVKSQFLKTVEEIGEISRLIGKLPNSLNGSDDYDTVEKYKPELALEIGDAFVTLQILASQLGLNGMSCWESAYEKISKRKGITKNGLFVKQS